MKTTVNVYQFRDAFRDMDRYDHFSYEGYQVLFDALEELADDTGSNTELDVIALCCDFVEYDFKEVCDTYSDIAAAVVSDHYDMAVDKWGFPIVSGDLWDKFLRQIIDENDKEFKDSVLNALTNHTFVCGTTDSTVIFQAF